ncbi:unnamed protein product [Rotaria sordida]|uniref:CRAL-TRIO domain-containing protein n=1 Tax=Rotaria sordida TaxID=392033 RepID=A0A815B5Z6_9BILA|nr:unnamed protein product [Rotaria sordida]
MIGEQVEIMERCLTSQQLLPTSTLLDHMLNNINTLSIFPAIWNLLKHVVDPVTKSKIIFIKKGAEIPVTLLQYIDSDQQSHEYDGSCQSFPTSPNCIPVYDRKEGTDDDN